MEIRHKNSTYETIANDLIATEECLKHLKASSVNIAYLSSDLEKKSNRREVYGQCEKVPDRYRWIIPYDFTITLFEPNIERLDDEQIRILLLHELMHIGIDVDGNEETYYVVAHDVEDFRDIIDKYGMDWSQ